MSTEGLARLQYFPKLNAELLRQCSAPKLIDIDEAPPRVAVAASAPKARTRGEGAGPRIERLRAEIKAATFTGKGDKEVVVGLYNRYISTISNAMIDSGEAVAGVYTGGRDWLRRYHGFGTYRMSNGSSYAGEWRANQIHGFGTYRNADGDVFEGQFEWGKKVGRGTETFSDGAVYDGEYRADQKAGHGTFHFATGDVYIGEFANDDKHGRGLYRYADGRVEVGCFKAGDDVGEGVRWSTDGQVAQLLSGGGVVRAILPDEAREVCERNGLPLPSEVLQADHRPPAVPASEGAILSATI